ncbi:DUF6916 family protein [Leifsonia naganoensis]|uniref:DUF6916 domain-containing protein n=1 Tax=Leifsonia naganoensis TaxID=150025 RepID=A0A853DRZ9_9MICO|nr:hypothetical protein [Leifsonia naganoensis]NYK10239.1 hypothetical protein [Leifsonia naganoensis]
MTATHADWAAVAGSEVRATAPDGTAYSLQLVDVSSARVENGWVAYTLRFESAADLPVEQQTYELVVGSIADPVFLVPTGRVADGLALEAVFAQAEPAPRISTSQKEN